MIENSALGPDFRGGPQGSQPLVRVALTAPECDFIRGLRGLGESPLSRRVLAAIEGLIRIGQEPCCLDAQADGVP